MTLPYRTATQPKPLTTNSPRTVETATRPAAPLKAVKGRSREAEAYRHWYGWAIWKKELRPDQLRRHPLCHFCDLQGRITSATVVDHRVPHRGDWDLFSDPANLTSCCAPCHDTIKAQIERVGYHSICDERGFAIDINHPSRVNEKRP